MAFARKHQIHHRMNVMVEIDRAGPNGLLIEKGKESSTYALLVEDGLLTHTLAHGTSRTYLRYRLTETGRAMLAHREAS